MAMQQALRFIVLAGVFALPFIVFIVANSLFFPFITGKNFAFRIIVEVMTGAWLVLALANSAFRPRRSWLLGAFAIFVGIVAIADALGVYPFKSFWSNYERMDGFVTLAHLFLYFVVTASILNTEKLWRAFWHTSLGASALMGVYGLLQLAGIASLNPGFSSVSRIDATFGNPIYLAVYMLFHIGIAALLWSRVSEERPNQRTQHAYLYGSIIALDTFVLFMTGTRGTMLGLIGGAVLGAILFALSSRAGRRLAITGIAGVALLAGTLYLARDQALVQRVPFLQRLATISLEDSTTKARFMNWGMAWEGVKERPILGWGQENYAIVFDKYYNPGMYGQEQWFDRVHNIVFDWLVAAGFLGLISYLALYACALWCLWMRDAFRPHERSILTGLLAAYFFHNLFVFDNIGSYMLFASLLAYIAFRASESAPTIPAPTIAGKALPIFVAGAIALSWGAAWYVNMRPLAANRALIQAIQPQKEGIMKNLEFFRESISYGTLGTQEAREQLAQVAVQVIRLEGAPVEVKRSFVEAAATEMAKQADASPLDARFPLFLGALLNAAGDLTNAEPALERAHQLSPGKQTILFEIAANRLAQEKTDEAIAAYKKAFELEPKYTEARILYAALVIRGGNDARGDELLAPILESGVAADPRIAAAYLARSRYDKIITIWEARVLARPSESQPYFTLAAAYYGAGNSARAIEVLEGVAEILPSAKEQADTLIEQIRSGAAKIQ
ncbi:O-antigen ligase family protein [Candidatus Kaiserbacteria bacterium]|nr:O-antigen ligase family protein [Candidatus Kaiserbacteria bacterium]